MHSPVTNNSHSNSNLPGISRYIVFALALVIGAWFMFQIIGVVFLFFFAVVLTLILNAPTMWLVKKKVPRTVAALMVFMLMLLFLFFLGWLVLPRILEQVSHLATQLPAYFDSIQSRLGSALSDYPVLQEKVMADNAFEKSLPSVSRLVTHLGRFSFSVIGGIFIAILFLSLVIYMLIHPRPLIETYLTFFPPHKRDRAAAALARSSEMMVGWMWSNLVVGTIEAVLIFFFLSYMGVPGVWVWVGLALFAEMVPKLGLYIMAAPPVLIALSVSPLTALWVLIFYLILNEIMGDFVMPKIRASTMNLHPVSSLLVMLAMAAAFGVIGALIATPLTAFIKAYYEAFYLSQVPTENLDKQVDLVLNRRGSENKNNNETI